jgi:hypothetical protein
VQLDGPGPGTGFNGIQVEASDCTIKGLVIRNFGDAGVLITGSGETGNRIEGNFVGTNRDGTSARRNPIGVYVASASNTVGGPEPDERNVISGNDGYGVFVSGFSDGDENRIEGNLIGTRADGTGDLGNTGDGVAIQNGAELTAVGGRSA